MQIFSSKYINKQTPIWLVSIAFLLSASFFTGYTGKANAFRQSIYTCRNYTSQNYKKEKSTVVYHCSPAALPETNAPVKSVSYKFSLLHFNNLTQIKVVGSRKIFNATKVTHLIASQRITNPFSEESPSLSFAL